MWVMIVMGSYFGNLYSQGTSAITPSIQRSRLLNSAVVIDGVIADVP